MYIMKNAPTGKGEGVEGLLADDLDTHSTNAARRQAVVRLGVPIHRADLIALLAFGDGRRGAGA